MILSVLWLLFGAVMMILGLGARKRELDRCYPRCVLCGKRSNKHPEWCPYLRSWDPDAYPTGAKVDRTEGGDL